MIRILSFHASYGCKHRGRCCTSGWPIGVDPDEQQKLEGALRQRVLTPVSIGTDAIHAGVIGTDHGRCVFHDAHPDGGCRIHRALGHAALPLACRQFPRQTVHHPGGTSITLSHYCPTAMALLETPGSITIVTNPPAFPATAEHVGLTADRELPPLIHSGLAMDWESWWLFEAQSVELLSEVPNALPRLELAVERIRQWSVHSGPLGLHIANAFADARRANVKPGALDESTIEARCADALAAVPTDWKSEAIDALSPSPGGQLTDRAWRQFIAAHAFANWTAYLGEGLRAWYRSVQAAACLLARTGDPGRVDLVLRHLADARELTERWNLAE